jgi:DNA-binding PadR family transcriptional regulator
MDPEADRSFDKYLKDFPTKGAMYRELMEEARKSKLSITTETFGGGGAKKKTYTLGADGKLK